MVPPASSASSRVPMFVDGSSNRNLPHSTALSAAKPIQHQYTEVLENDRGSTTNFKRHCENNEGNAESCGEGEDEASHKRRRLMDWLDEPSDKDASTLLGGLAKDDPWRLKAEAGAKEKDKYHDDILTKKSRFERHWESNEGSIELHSETLHKQHEQVIDWMDESSDGDSILDGLDKDDPWRLKVEEAAAKDKKKAGKHYDKFLTEKSMLELDKIVEPHYCRWHQFWMEDAPVSVLTGRTTEWNRDPVDKNNVAMDQAGAKGTDGSKQFDEPVSRGKSRGDSELDMFFQDAVEASYKQQQHNSGSSYHK